MSVGVIMMFYPRNFRMKMGNINIRCSLKSLLIPKFQQSVKTYQQFKTVKMKVLLVACLCFAIAQASFPSGNGGAKSNPLGDILGVKISLLSSLRSTIGGGAEAEASAGAESESESHSSSGGHSGGFSESQASGHSAGEVPITIQVQIPQTVPQGYTPNGGYNSAPQTIPQSYASNGGYNSVPQTIPQAHDAAGGYSYQAAAPQSNYGPPQPAPHSNYGAPQQGHGYAQQAHAAPQVYVSQPALVEFHQVGAQAGGHAAGGSQGSGFSSGGESESELSLGGEESHGNAESSSSGGSGFDLGSIIK